MVVGLLVVSLCCWYVVGVVYVGDDDFVVDIGECVVDGGVVVGGVC